MKGFEQNHITAVMWFCIHLFGVTCIKDKKGRLTIEAGQIKLVWKEYVEELLNEEFDWQKENLEQVSEVSGECEKITFDEVKVAFNKAKSGKPPGPSGVVGEMLKTAGDVGIQWMTDLCNAVVSEGKIPEAWGG